MSTSGGAAATRPASRRATLSVANGGALLRGNGSLSPQRAFRKRVLRERGNEPGSDVGAAGKATKTQQMQFAFGSKIIKPSSGKAGMPTRTSHGTPGAVAANAGGLAPASRSRRERATRYEPQEQQQRASSRGRGAMHRELQQPATTSLGQVDVAALKAQMEKQEAMQEAIIAELRRNLAEERAKGNGAPEGKSEAATAPSASDSLKAAGEVAGARKEHPSRDELDEGEQATLRAVEEEVRAEAEEKLARVEAVAAAGLSQLAELQARVDEMLRGLKARRK